MTKQKYNYEGNSYRTDLGYFKLALLHALSLELPDFTFRGIRYTITEAQRMVEVGQDIIERNSREKFVEIPR